MKMLKTKHFRRIAVFLAMIAPAVYLFGSLFSALTGAHGEQVFADRPIDTGSQYVSADDISITGSYRFTFDGDFSVSSFLGVNFGFNSNGIDFYHMDIYADNQIFYLAGPDNAVLARNASGVWQSENYKVLTFDVSSLPSNASRVLDFGSLEYLSYFSPETQFGDYVFGQFFEKDNFLVHWGENAISENPYGFAPFGAFWRYLDLNVLHLSNEQIGLMAYGYMYYAAHVLLFDIGFILVTFFLDFIQKVADKFTGGE